MNSLKITTCLVPQSCLTLCYPVDYSLSGFSCPWGFSRQEYWSGLPCPPPGDLPNPGIKPRPPAMQMDSLPAEPQGKHFSEKLSKTILIPADPLLFHS